MPPHASGCTTPRHVPLGEPQSDAWVGELERRPEVVTCRGGCLAAPGNLPLARTGRDAWRVAKSFLEMPWLAFPASSSCRGLCSSAGRPGKLLLPGPGLLGLSTLFLNGPKRDHGGFWRHPGKPCREVLLLPVHRFGVLRYPYFSTPTASRPKVQSMVLLPDHFRSQGPSH